MTKYCCLRTVFHIIHLLTDIKADSTPWLYGQHHSEHVCIYFFSMGSSEVYQETVNFDYRLGSSLMFGMPLILAILTYIPTNYTSAPFSPSHVLEICILIWGWDGISLWFSFALWWLLNNHSFINLLTFYLSLISDYWDFQLLNSLFYQGLGSKDINPMRQIDGKTTLILCKLSSVICLTRQEFLNLMKS